MLSDESSSDSETGRFKCQPTNITQNSERKEDRHKTSDKGRHRENDRFNRDFGRQREVNNHFNRRDKDRDRDRHRYSRHSPMHRRRHSRDRSLTKRHSRERRFSRDRSPYRKSRERQKQDRNSGIRSKPRDLRSISKDRKKPSRSKSREKLVDHKKSDMRYASNKDASVSKNKREDRESISLSPDIRGKRSEVHKPITAPARKKSNSPIVINEICDSDKSEEVLLGSYYSMIPAVIKDKSEESSEIDSSDDEKLRAKLLNLEKKLHKTKKKKHKHKKHKRKTSKSQEREQEIVVVPEVTSTTDIQNKLENEEPNQQDGVIIEVSSTQKPTQKESSEEGEISSDDELKEVIDIDPSDLRHKLLSRKDGSKKKTDVCGPALPPHLQSRFKSSSPEAEGPALPPHLQRKSNNIGPSIPDDMRKVLAETKCEVIHCEDSDEDKGYGPIPVGNEEKMTDAHRKLEERALEMKMRQIAGHSLNADKVKSREQWMLELPEGKAKYVGLEARSFRAKEGPDMSDRSSWTDTPEEKARKAAGFVKDEDVDAELRRDARSRQIETRDLEQEDAVKKHKKKHKRDESLLDIHQKKLKKKKKKEDRDDDRKERRPFSRDVDLQVNRFDEAQKRSIIKKAQDLDTRFSKGEAKYL